MAQQQNFTQRRNNYSIEHNCGSCPYKAKTNFGLKIHEKIHAGGTFVCAQCGACFVHKNTLSKHESQYHSIGTYCKRCKIYVKILSVHYRKIHNKNKELVLAVDHQSKKLHSVKNLKLIQEKASTNENRIEAEVAAKLLIGRKKLRDLKKTEDPTSPHICQVCLKVCATYDLLLLHFRTKKCRLQ